MHYYRKVPQSTRAGSPPGKPHRRRGAPKHARQRHGANRRLAARADQLSGRAWRDGVAECEGRP